MSALVSCRLNGKLSVYIDGSGFIIIISYSDGLPNPQTSGFVLIGGCFENVCGLVFERKTND